MAQRGRPFKPVGLHLVDGTYRPDRHGDRSDLPKSRPPRCPPHVVGEQRKIFNWLVRKLKPMNVLTSADDLMLEGLAAQIMSFRQAQKEYEQYGTLYAKTKSGWPAPAPYIQMRDTSWKNLSEVASRFGMDPRSRTQMRVELMKPEDPFENYRNAKPKKQPA